MRDYLTGNSTHQQSAPKQISIALISVVILAVFKGRNCKSFVRRELLVRAEREVRYFFLSLMSALKVLAVSCAPFSVPNVPCKCLGRLLEIIPGLSLSGKSAAMSPLKVLAENVKLLFAGM